MELPSLDEQKGIVKAAVLDFRTLMKDCISGPRDKPMRTMIRELMPRLKKTPASSRESFHSAYAGGFIVHNVNVIRRALSLRDAWTTKKAVSDGMIFRVGFVHDLGKIGTPEGAEHYKLQSDDYWQSRGHMYEINKDLIGMSVPVRSLWILNRYGVQLTQREWQAVAYSDGQYVPSGREIAHQEQKLTLIIQAADYWSAHIDRV